MNLCGHGTMVAIRALNDYPFLTEKAKIRVETKVGILTIKVKRLNDGQFWMTMQQALPVFEAFLGSHTDLAQVMGLAEHDIANEWEYRNLDITLANKKTGKLPNDEVR